MISWKMNELAFACPCNCLKHVPLFWLECQFDQINREIFFRVCKILLAKSIYIFSNYSPMASTFLCQLHSDYPRTELKASSFLRYHQCSTGHKTRWLSFNEPFLIQINSLYCLCDSLPDAKRWDRLHWCYLDWPQTLTNGELELIEISTNYCKI